MIFAPTQNKTCLAGAQQAAELITKKVSPMKVPPVEKLLE